MTAASRRRPVTGPLEEPVEQARELAERLGLQPCTVHYWLVDHEETNALAAYEGFQHRYPHWRWGMAYDRFRKQDRYGRGKIFELVNNDDPANAFLQESNSLADQKAVITHVEAHVDFFQNNRWFRSTDDGPDAAATLERHARIIKGYMRDPEVDRSAVERWIDNVLTVEDTIDQHRGFVDATVAVESGAEPDDDPAAAADALDLSPEVRDAVFDDDWHDRLGEDEVTPEQPVRDVLAFLRVHGRQYDHDAGRAAEMADWQRRVIDILRREAYYFAPQKITKVMNEGWAAFWESRMMAEETFAEPDEFIDYADHQSRVLGSPGFNPYKLGRQLWEHIEATTDRREVVERLLQVDGVDPGNFHDVVDFEVVAEAVAPPEALDRITTGTLDDLEALEADYVDSGGLEAARAGEFDVGRYPWRVLTTAGLVRRHYSLARPRNRGFVRQIGRSELEEIGRYILEVDRYPSVEAALADIDHAAGRDRMFEVRRSHNDVTFIDEFLTQEFVDEHGYFAFEHSHAADGPVVSGTDVEAVKKKLLLRFTNFGKPTIVVLDGNFENRNELLLGHRYNGIALDIERAKRTLERVFELWGRPVNLLTIVKQLDEAAVDRARRRKEEPEPEEQGLRLRYDGDEFEDIEVDWEVVERIAASDVDYDTKPDDWLS